MNIDLSEFWDENYYNNPPLTDEMVVAAEESLGVKLPDSFINLLKTQNGGYTSGFAFPMDSKTSWADDHVPFTEGFGIVTDKNSESGHNILQTEYMIEEWGLPEDVVLLTGDGHWFIVLDYRKGSEPSIRWIDVECEQDTHVADTFDDFLNGLIIYDELEERNNA